MTYAEVFDRTTRAAGQLREGDRGGPEVKTAVYEHPAVAEIAVIGVPDATWGEVGRAFVITVPGCGLTIGELRAFRA
ncbi:hypothetical protein ACFPOI_22255 [Nonomuraea angiospora]|nr:hypothetical protein [Nonomuraea angiospora]